jgi:cell division protein FtsB
MKSLLIIPVLLFGACATNAPRKPGASSIIGPPNRPTSAAALRTPEQLREYRFGRYVDPSDPLAMHESHPVYRVETSTSWNLRPSSAALLPTRPLAPAPNVLANDAVVAEVNKQRAATRAFTEQSARLNEKLAAMTQATAKVEELARQNVALKREVVALRESMNAPNEQPRDGKTTSSGGPPPRTEDKW